MAAEWRVAMGLVAGAKMIGMVGRFLGAFSKQPVIRGTIVHPRRQDHRNRNPIGQTETLIAALAVAAGVAIAGGWIEAAIVLTIWPLLFFSLDALPLRLWCILVVGSALVGRALQNLLGLPPSVGFLHYPIVFALWSFVAIAQSGTHKRSSRTLQMSGLGALLICLMSAVVNQTHPLRVIFFLTILAEPLLVIYAICSWRKPGKETRVFLKGWATLMALQIPFALWQGFTFGWWDPVVGTMIGFIAGAHVLGGVFALSAFIALDASFRRALRPAKATLIVTVAVLLITATGALQVAIAMLIAIPVAVLASGHPRLRTTKLRGTSRARLAFVAAVLAIGAPIAAEAVAPGITERARELASPTSWPEVQLVAQRATADPVAALIGSGPGTTGSRASLLLTPALRKEESPVASINLPPTEGGLEIAQSTRNNLGGSAESFASSSLGIVGDIGLLGVGIVALILARLWQLCSPGAELSMAARFGLLMTAVLMFVDNWLEYPEYSLPLAVVVGLAIRNSSDGGNRRKEHAESANHQISEVSASA